MKDNRFKGPLFIVGLSRSGTKLIRDLLNRNEQIALPEIETHFIPKYLRDKDLSIKEIYKGIGESSFVGRFPNLEYPSFDRLKELMSVETKHNLIEAILKFYAIEGVGNWPESTIWGDKTPSYLRYLDLLKSEFTECKIVHIIRDPRDRAMSVKKTWNKSMYRATELWRREIQQSDKWKHSKSDYIQFTYEELLKNPEKVMRNLCDFLGIEFTEKMLYLSKPSEKYGENSKDVRIGSSNMRNYQKENQKIIKRLEEIAYPQMKDLQYEIHYAKKFKPFPSYKMHLFKYVDFLNFKLSNLRKGY